MVQTTERDFRNYPPLSVDKDCVTGFMPIDFIVERFLEIGFEWFRTDPRAPNLVFAHLTDKVLADKYGQAKIDEITEYIKNTEIDIKQAFPMEDEESPSISINLQSSTEADAYVGLDDHANQIVALGSDGSILGRANQGYTPVRDEILIGIHATASPDKTKYLYYLIVYIINAFKDRLENREDRLNSLFNISWRATDISRMNQYLPSHVFSRFVTLTAEHFALFEKAELPYLDSFDVFVETELESFEGR